MTPLRWQQIKDVFDAALERDGPARREWLEHACAGDEALRNEVDSLLVAHEAPSCFIDSPIMERVERATSSVAKLSWVGRTIGRYTILEEIGRGGMSSVYRAARVEEHFEHQVAVKVLRHGPDSEQVLRRFRVERQILARLSHPNIAHLLDGGSTADGTPYLVMEYVRGEPIDEYCRRKQLDVTARLRLFRSLCEAVHYVHRHLMVHADLKCSNVLVNEDGIVKLLDFGVAKLVDPAIALGSTQHRPTGLLALTPEYASPEQIRGEPVTTASDVYSLGVLLYWLLTLQLPHRSASGSYYELASRICETEPTRPSLAARKMADLPCPPERLRGDLDNIILRALDKDPDRRYASAEQFSHDVGLYLRGFPVMAAVPAPGYRLRRFVARNRALAITGMLVALSLVGGILATGWQAHVAGRERERAERHFTQVRDLAQTFMLDVHDSITSLPGATQARSRILENSLKYLDALASEKADDPELQRDLARAYERVGDLQDGYLAVDLRDTELALGSLRRAGEIRESLWNAGERDDELLRDRFHVTSKLAQLSQSNRAIADAKRYSALATTLAQMLVSRPAATRGDQRLLANSFVVRGTLEAMTADLDTGLVDLRRGVTIYEKNILDGDRSPEMRRSQAVGYSRIGGLLAKRGGRHAEAYAAHLRALDIIESMLATDPLNFELRALAAHELMSAGEAASRTGDSLEGLRRREASADRFRSLVAEEPSNEELRFDLGWALSDLGESLHERGDPVTAADKLQEARELLVGLAGFASPRLNTTQFLVAMNDVRMARLKISRARTAQGVSETERSALRTEARSLLTRAEPVIRAAEKDELLSQEAAEYRALIDTTLAEGHEEALNRRAAERSRAR